MFRTSPRLAAELWDAYVTICPQPAVALRFHLERLGMPAASMAALDQRFRHFATLLPPRALLQASGSLSPEGPERRKDVIQFESKVLGHVDPHGGWLLHGE
jgi:hypothetical protein